MKWFPAKRLITNCKHRDAIHLESPRASVSQRSEISATQFHEKELRAGPGAYSESLSAGTVRALPSSAAFPFQAWNMSLLDTLICMQLTLKHIYAVLENHFITWCVHMFSLHACMGTACVPSDATRGHQIPGTGLQMVVNYHMVAGNWTLVLRESSQFLNHQAVSPAPVYGECTRS